MAEDLTVIVVALLGGAALEQCVRAMHAQCPDVIVVHRDGIIADADGSRVGMAGRLDVPAKRWSGVELASTPLVALIEDTVLPEAGWADAVATSLRGEDVVACGGPVRMAAGLPAQTRALILSEYAQYNDRCPPGEVAALPGCNFAFRRDTLLDALRGSDGMVDLPIFARLRELGGKLAWAPDAAVRFSHAYPEGARLRTRFDHGRIYGSSNGGLVGRAATIVKFPLLPVVLTGRALKRSGSAPLSTVGWLLLQHSAWAAGELAGAVLGPSRRGLGAWQ